MSAADPEPWNDGAAYKWIWPIEVVTERTEPVARTQPEIDVLAGKHVLLHQWSELDQLASARMSSVLAPRVGAADLVFPAIDLGFFEEDHRRMVDRSIAARRGQPRFRSDLLNAYAGRCAVSGTGATEVLEAAHIHPYRGDHTNRVDNGLLLRSDIHTLFDLALLTVTPALTVRVSGDLARTEYWEFDGQPLGAPAAPYERPAAAVLHVHNERCRWLRPNP